MSVYNSSTAWDGACSGANQSPINLSQSLAKPCDLLCDLAFDDGNVADAYVTISDEGMILHSKSGLGTCRFNGEGYTCNNLMLTHPSHHTVENIQADAEVVAMFTNPTGQMLCVSSLVRVNPSQSDSAKFFNAFVGYANPSTRFTAVSLGEGWGLGMMVPPHGAYFVYDGSMVVPPCQSVKWVVFKSMIHMDANNFALLAKNVSPGSRAVQPLGDRDVFFNDAEQLSGGPMPHDNKTYMRCRRAGKKSDVKPVVRADVGGERKKASPPSAIYKWAGDQMRTNGIIAFLDVILLVCAIVFGIYYGWNASKKFTGLYFAFKAQDFAVWVRKLFSRPPRPA